LSLPAHNALAIVGAGPIGLEAALCAIDRGFDVHVFERGEVGAHPQAWGHVRMFTPWKMNLGPVSSRHLRAAGWSAPDPEALPTGGEFVEGYLRPLAALPALQGRVHLHAQVVHMSRRGALKGDLPDRPERREHPFRLLVRDPGGRENYIHSFALIDASGVYGQPNWAGDGGIPARQELYLAPQLSYHVDDVLGLRRDRHAGRRTLVLGGGASAATTILALAQLADQVPGTSAVWVTRQQAHQVCPGVAGDPLAERAKLYERARALAGGTHAAVLHAGGAVIEGFEFNSATHRYRVLLRSGEQARVEEVDHVIVNTGYGPDHSLYRELQVRESHLTRGPATLADALRGAGSSDCLSTPVFGSDALAHPEPAFYILGHKSYGRSPAFLLETGYQQVGSVIERLAEEQHGLMAAPRA